MLAVKTLTQEKLPCTRILKFEIFHSPALVNNPECAKKS